MFAVQKASSIGKSGLSTHTMFAMPAISWTLQKLVRKWNI